MSKDLINFDDFQLPAYLQDHASESSASLVTQRESIPRISLKGTQFTFKKDGEEKSMARGAVLSIVVLSADPPDASCAKSYYESPYRKDSEDPPDCSSSDGVRPDSFVDNPQCAACASCHHNEWGTAKDTDGNFTKGKRCADIKKLLVVSPGRLDGDIFMLRVPPTSLKNLSAYGRQLKKHRVPLEACVTRIEFADTEILSLDFSFGGPLDEKDGLQAIARAKTDDIQDLLHIAAPIKAQDLNQPESKPEPEKKEPVDDIPDFGGSAITGADESKGEHDDDGYSLDAEKQRWNPEQHDPEMTKYSKGAKKGCWRLLKDVRGKAAAPTAKSSSGSTSKPEPVSEPANEGSSTASLDDIMSVWED